MSWPSTQGTGAEEECPSEDSLACSDKPPVFLSTVHPERLLHLRRGSEPNHLGLVLNCEGRQNDRYDALLPERHTTIERQSHRAGRWSPPCNRFPKHCVC